MKLKIGSRGSRLAVVQAEWVGEQLKSKHPSLEIEYSRIVTTGDRDAQSSLTAIGGKGVFVKEIEEALLRGDIDLAVHSLKDVPQQIPPGLIIGPVPQREDARDVIISRFGERLSELPRQSIIGTSSPRRIAQIQNRYASRKYRIQPIRGNVETRIKKLQQGDYDAIVLAYAGVKRIGMQGEISDVLETDEMMPAPCQGALGLELKETNRDVWELIHSISDPTSDLTARAERAFLQGLGGSCLIPVAAVCKVAADKLAMKALLLNPAGTETVVAEQDGPKEAPELVGGQLAERLLYNGGSELLLKAEQAGS